MRVADEPIDAARGHEKELGCTSAITLAMSRASPPSRRHARVDAYDKARRRRRR